MGKKDAIGYHPIRTIFQAVGLFDELGVSLREAEFPVQNDMAYHSVGNHLIGCDWRDFPAESTISKALRLAEEIAIVPPLLISLQKRIPAQSGLGGGSSNAASTLVALSRLGVGILPHEVMDVAKAVGADVPFFLVGGRAKAEGYGEILTPLAPLPTETYVIARPQTGCETGPMYAALDNLEFPWREFPSVDELYNDFERVAPCESLDLIDTLRTLGARDAGLSGSGSAVFGRFLASEKAEQAKNFLVERLDCQAWTAISLDRAF